MTPTALIMRVLTLIDLAERLFPRLRREIDGDEDR
jgi:hypothetical protein